MNNLLERRHDRLTETSEIIFYEMPKLERRLQDILAGKADIETLSKEEEWCMYIKYRHEYDARQEGLVEGRAEGLAEGKREEKQNIITLLKSGKSAEEIIQFMENE
jgi:hypothetical protein